MPTRQVAIKVCDSPYQIVHGDQIAVLTGQQLNHSTATILAGRLLLQQGEAIQLCAPSERLAQ